MAVAGLTVAVLFAIWFAFFVFVYLPRGASWLSFECVDSDVVELSERRWAYVVAGVVALRLRRDHLRRRALGRSAAVECGDDRCQPPPSCPASSWRPISARRFSRTDRRSSASSRSNIRSCRQCIVVPTDTPVVFRVTSPDVVHGFLIAGTNVNSMVVPGFVAEVRTRFDKPGDHLMPCHEYCSVGHEGMWARVKVVDRLEFARPTAAKQRASCARQ